jgi:hypothetical protein
LYLFSFPLLSLLKVPSTISISQGETKLTSYFCISLIVLYFLSPTASSCEPSAWNMAALSSPLLKTEFTYKSQPITIPHSGSRTHPYADHERAFTPPRTDAPQHYRQGSDQDRFVVRGRPQPFVVSSPTRKIKTDGRKCRKVYGMENKHLWCTQCKWKKACTRFTD